uniref:(northern house mosquito) hypothetical protein n=1 Tax=Culex pipiens TaxID=7175 RepID=A0A8D8BVJ2_CULPI
MIALRRCTGRQRSSSSTLRRRSHWGGGGLAGGLFVGAFGAVAASVGRSPVGRIAGPAVVVVAVGGRSPVGWPKEALWRRPPPGCCPRGLRDRSSSRGVFGTWRWPRERLVQPELVVAAVVGLVEVEVAPVGKPGPAAVVECWS